MGLPCAAMSSRFSFFRFFDIFDFMQRIVARLATFALVGWFLMVQPPENSVPAVNGKCTAFTGWQQWGPYRTEKECEGMQRFLKMDDSSVCAEGDGRRFEEEEIRNFYFPDQRLR